MEVRASGKGRGVQKLEMVVEGRSWLGQVCSRSIMVGSWILSSSMNVEGENS